MRELAALLGAGIGAERALAIAAKTASRPKLKKPLGRLHELVRGGTPFAAALRDALPGLPASGAGLVEAGEATARLPDGIAQAAAMLEAGLAFRRSLTSALIYPAILLATSVAAVIFLLAFVVPQFKSAFAEAGTQLPLATQALIAIGEWFVRVGPYVLAGFLGGGALLVRWIATPAGRLALDGFLLRVPIFRDFLVHAEMARFARTVSLLLSSRVPLVRAMKLAETGTGNSVLRTAIRKAGGRAKEGERLASSIAANGPWPADAIEIIGIGEESGRLDVMLAHLADLYEGDLKRRSERLLTLLTPILTLAMAGIVAAIIGAILSAILGAYDLPL